MYHHRRIWILAIGLLIVSLACNLQSITLSRDEGTAEEITPTPGEEDQVQGEPPTPAPLPSSTTVPTATLTPTATLEPTATIQHIIRPDAPGTHKRFLTDLSSLAYADEKRAVGDHFESLRLERPFTTDTMNYQPYLDLVRGELDLQAPWVYVTISLEGPPPSDMQLTYSVELDVDRDGRGDWLISASGPFEDEWSVVGVRAYEDANDDIGGERPLRADPQPQPVDGYDELVFDQGIGSDPDAAWARVTVEKPAEVQIAFKLAMVGNPTSFMWGLWADGGPDDVAYFDYNDHFPPDAAGSPLSNSSDYPVKALASVDNTCRDAYGFSTTGNEPGLCVLPSSIGGVVWKDRCLLTGGEGGEPLVLGKGCVSTGPEDWQWGADQVYEPDWEPPLVGVTIHLGSGACPSTGLQTKKTDGNGRYTFGGLTAGTYCISFNPLTDGNDTILIPGGLSYPTRGGDAQWTVDLALSQNRLDISFGWLFQFGD
jgi:hypothetical protein